MEWWVGLEGCFESENCKGWWSQPLGNEMNNSGVRELCPSVWTLVEYPRTLRVDLWDRLCTC